jgi:LAGLIDADG DNA endonuclease family
MLVTHRLITVEPTPERRPNGAKMGNAVGSLSEVQRAIVIGSLLGDGSMRCKTNALLEINHSTHQRSYVDWKFSQLADLVTTPPKERKGNGGRVAYRFVTRSDPALTPYYRLFYAGGRKRVPEVELAPLSLAVWFMDDGCRSRNAVYLNTQQFDEQGQRTMLKMLSKQWGLDATLNRDKSYYRIRVSVRSTKRLAELIRPYLLSELRYKLPRVTP